MPHSFNLTSLYSHYTFPQVDQLYELFSSGSLHMLKPWMNTESWIPPLSLAARITSGHLWFSGEKKPLQRRKHFFSVTTILRKIRLLHKAIGFHFTCTAVRLTAALNSVCDHILCRHS